MLRLKSITPMLNTAKAFRGTSFKTFATTTIKFNDSKEKDSSSNKNERLNLIKTVDTLENFKQHLSNEKEPIIIDFFAAWCGPCKLLTPKLQEAIVEYNKFKLFKVDIDKVPELAQLYQISSVPTVLAIHNSQEIHKFIGFQNTPGLVKFLDEVSTRSQL